MTLNKTKDLLLLLLRTYWFILSGSEVGWWDKQMLRVRPPQSFELTPVSVWDWINVKHFSNRMLNLLIQKTWDLQWLYDWRGLPTVCRFVWQFTIPAYREQNCGKYTTPHHECQEGYRHKPVFMFSHHQSVTLGPEESQQHTITNKEASFLCFV